MTYLTRNQLDHLRRRTNALKARGLNPALAEDIYETRNLDRLARLETACTLQLRKEQRR